MHAPRAILAGDHMQLPPTLTSPAAAAKGPLSLLERAVTRLGPSCVRLLSVQYRMHREIMQWSSDTFYEGHLIADEANAEHLLTGLSGVQETEDTSAPLVLVDTAGCNMPEQTTEDQVHVPVCLPVCLSVCLPPCLPASVPVCLLACLPACALFVA
jgi:ATP-dependent RNA/DNA helicase IGHMBP2